MRGCAPYTGADRVAIQVQADFHALGGGDEERPDRWKSIDYHLDGCSFYFSSENTSGPRSLRRGFFLAVCDLPRRFVQGFPIRSEEVMAYADCDRNLFSASQVLGREGRFGGQIRTFYQRTLNEVPLKKAVLGSLSMEIVKALCSN